MKRLLLSSTALTAVLIAVPALAADLPVKAPQLAPPPAPLVYNWTGFYVGLNAGGAWGSSDPSTSASCVSLGTLGPYFTCADAARVTAAGTGSMSGSAFTGGGQLGYNWQSNSAVFGAELDFDSFHVRASRQGGGIYSGFAGANPAGPFTVVNSVSTDWLFTARARVGWAINQLLAYATGGLALTDLHGTNTYVDTTVNNPNAIWNTSATKLGWTVGGGLEWALNQNWSVKAEYLYVNFGSITANAVVGIPAYANAISTSTDLTAHIARGGVNYKF